MKIDIRYPLLFSALPSRCYSRKDVFVSFLHTADVPEVSERDVETVFAAETSTPYRLVEFDGRLFRKLGALSDHETSRLLDYAFQKDEERNRPWPFTFENGRANPRPVSQALNNHLCHRLYLEGGEHRQKQIEAWPFVPFLTGLRGSRTSRNDFRFEDLERKLADIDGEEFGKGRAEHAAEAAKLIVIERDLWIETTPPAIKVGVAGFNSSARMVMELSHLPTWLDADLDVQYFPLTDHSAALEYAERATKLTHTGTQPFEDYTHERPFTTDTTDLLSFDGDGYSCARTALILGGDVARSITNAPELVEKIGDGRARAALLARDMAKAIGTDISAWPDMGDLVNDITEAWKMTGRKPGWANIPANRHGFGTMICDRAADTGKISVFATLAKENKP
ncbi:hypothetical protein [Rhizobium sp. BK176]|uniref:hypothetical protein n=1 Tax=Rhizobium sp. BK176 TaxID=2587071 RepID=UPI0021699DC2|nr:hypothetical protein [Rhizobium sp. BK176]MCS4089453.1 hypothetical protein [Rhizobium sp. BK176]